MDDDKYYDIFKVKGTLALKSKKEFVAMIPRIYKSGIYKKKGFGSIFECAAKLGGVSHATVEEAIRIDEKLADLPKLRKLMPTVGLSKLRKVSNIAQKETENEWVLKVQKMSKSALETHIRDINNSRPGPRERIESLFDNNFESFAIKLNPRPANPELRKVSTKERREALAKTNGKCSVPGCNKPAEEIHHKNPWAIFKSHKQLKPLCKPHHELAHQGNNVVDQKFRKYKMQVATQP